MACVRHLAALAGGATAALATSWSSQRVFADTGSKSSKPKSLNDLYFGLMTKSRRILLSGGVDDESAKQIVGQLMYLEMESPGTPITFYIHSTGGNVQSGLYIYDMMQHISSPVHTVCAGRCYSMAAILLAAGEKGERSALPHCRVMVHQPNRNVSGSRTSRSLHIDADALETTRKTLNSILEKHAALSAEEIEQAMENDTYMNASEALNAGLLDKILEPMQKGAAGKDDSSVQRDAQTPASDPPESSSRPATESKESIKRPPKNPKRPPKETQQTSNEPPTHPPQTSDRIPTNLQQSQKGPCEDVVQPSVKSQS